MRNAPNLVAEALLTVQVRDENNQPPVFTSVESGSVLEHQSPGTIVMQVRAVDADGTYPNNQVEYRVAKSNREDVGAKFAVDPRSGVVTTRQEFDREEQVQELDT